MQNPEGVSSAVEGWGEGVNDKFKVVKQIQTASQPSLKFDMGSEIGMTQINTAESTKIQTGPEVGKGSLVDEVF